MLEKEKEKGQQEAAREMVEFLLPFIRSLAGSIYPVARSLS